MEFLIIWGTTKADIVIFEIANHLSEKNIFNAGANETNQRSAAQTFFELEASKANTLFKNC